MTEPDMIERVARAIAAVNGDTFDEIHASKLDWNRTRGFAGGRFRDINEPRKADYFDMARAAIEAMRDLSPAVLAAVIPEPTHLYQGRSDEIVAQFRAATAIDRLALLSRMSEIVDAALAAYREKGE